MRNFYGNVDRENDEFPWTCSDILFGYCISMYIYILVGGRLCVTHKMKNRGTGKTNLFGVWLVNGK